MFQGIYIGGYRFGLQFDTSVYVGTYNMKTHESATKYSVSHMLSILIRVMDAKHYIMSKFTGLPEGKSGWYPQV
jgi:high-affinity nickel permease